MTQAKDKIWVDSRTVGGRRRTGEIVEVLGAPNHVRYRVRWEDGQETIVYPGSDTAVARSVKRPKRPAREVRRRKPTSAQAARPPATATVRAAPGDRLVIRPHRLGEPQRDAEVLQVLGPEGRPPFRVRWEDTGADTVLFPGSDALVEHFEHPKPAARQARASRRTA